MQAFVGIDMAFAKGKLLPICVCTWEGTRHVPVPIRQADLLDIPRGAGNRGSIDPAVVAEFANNVAKYLHAVERHFGLKIERVAIDAPSSPKAWASTPTSRTSSRLQADFVLYDAERRYLMAPAVCENLGS